MTAAVSDHDESRARRSPTEVRRLIEQAARDLFERRGYSETSTRDIARAAGVTQAAIFRHYGRKETLFEAVVLQPLSDFTDAFTERWKDDEQWRGSNEERTLDYVQELTTLIRENRVLFAMLAAAGSPGAEAGPLERAASLLNEHLEAFVRELERRTAQQHVTTMDMDRAVRFSISVVLGATLFDSTLFPSETGGPSVDLDRAIAAFVLRGVVLRPAEHLQ